MFKAIDESGGEIRIDDVQDGEKYYCPICKSLLVVRAKKSQTIATHFAHKSLKDCDTFKHDMSDWHKAWQNIFPIRNQEVPLPFDNPCHRADVLAYGYVIEFQHSPISAEEFDERNKFYTSIGKKVVWIFDVQEKYVDGRFSMVEPRYEYDGSFVADRIDGQLQKKWIVNEYRIGHTFYWGCNEESTAIGYEYGRNEKYAKQKTHEWHWTRPLTNFIHFYPLANPDVTVFLEFAPDRLQKVIWCDEDIDTYKSGYLSYRYDDEITFPSIGDYLKQREKFVIKSDFRYFTATEYTVKQFLSAIRDRIL